MADKKPIKAESKLSHFKFWRATQQKLTQAVDLLGQFDQKNAVTVTLTEFQWIGNPVRKRHDDKKYGIKDESVHLLGYYFERPTGQPNRKVTIRNQIQDAEDGVEWTILPPNYLLVPATKEVVKGEKKPPEDKKPPSLGPPADFYHFECYQVVNPEELKLTVKLLDQFDKEFRPKQDKNKKPIEQDELIPSLKPNYFCVPVSKTVGKKKYPIPGEGKPDEEPPHLALYFFQVPALNPHRWAWARDQFHDKAFLVEVQQPFMLAVPTDKLSWKPVTSTGTRTDTRRRDG